MSGGYETIGQAVTDPVFAELDLALRRGYHVGEEDLRWYTFLTDARPQLQAFYSLYGWSLVHREDGFFFLLPRKDDLGSTHVSPAGMLIGQACLLLLLDSAPIHSGVRVSRQQILEHLISVLGEDETAVRLTGKGGRRETRQADLVHQRLNGALRELHGLGFVDRIGDEVLLRPRLTRFGDPVRGDGNWRERLAVLIAEGQLIVDREDPATGEKGDDNGPG